MVDTNFQCQVCLSDNKITEESCTVCHEPLPSDKEKLKILADRCKLEATNANANENISTPREDVQELQNKLRGLMVENATLKDIIADAQPCPLPTTSDKSFSQSEPVSLSNTYQLFRGKMNGVEVVRKTLSSSIFSNDEAKDKALKKLKSSMRLVAKLNGENADCILKPIAISGYGTDNLAIYTPFMGNLDLQTRMANNFLPALTNYAKLEIALRIIRAINDIHAINLLHRDINPTHVLLDDNDIAKLSGLSNVREVAEMMTSGVGVKRYAAPETFEGCDDETSVSKYTEKADIYSFGLLLVFLFTGEAPFSHVKDRSGRSINDMSLTGKIMNSEIDTSSHPATPFPALDALIRRCTIKDGEHRPSATEVVKSIKKLLYDDIPAERPDVKVRIQDIRAEGLPDTETFGGQDSYCKVHKDGEERRTDCCIRGGRNPRWPESFEFDSVDLAEDALAFKIRKRNSLWFNQDIGCCTLTLLSALKKNHHDIEVHKQGNVHGKLMVNVSFEGDVKGWLRHFIASGTSYINSVQGETTQSRDLKSKLNEAKIILDGL